MRHRHEDGSGRRFAHPEDQADRRHLGHHGGRFANRHRTRAFDYGELRLLVLSMIAEAPRHGYELIKAIEERMGGSYSPSPGVMYPTLSWLEDMGFAEIENTGGSRKLYRITTEGEAFLAANRATLDDLSARTGSIAAGGPGGMPAPVLRGMENLKLALRLRLRQGEVDKVAAEKIAAALDAAAQVVERS